MPGNQAPHSIPKGLTGKKGSEVGRAYSSLQPACSSESPVQCLFESLFPSDPLGVVPFSDRIAILSHTRTNLRVISHLEEPVQDVSVPMVRVEPLGGLSPAGDVISSPFATINSDNGLKGKTESQKGKRLMGGAGPLPEAFTGPSCAGRTAGSRRWRCSRPRPARRPCRGCRTPASGRPCRRSP